MEYENCPGEWKGSKPLLYAVIAVLIILFIFTIWPFKQTLIPVRGGANILFGVPVNASKI